MKKRSALKNFFLRLSCAALALTCGIACCACKKDESYSDWQHDDKYHWRYNSKGEIVDKGIHNFLWWQCTLCNYTIAPPEPEGPPPDLPEDPDPQTPDPEEPDEDDPSYDEPLPDDPWADNPDDPLDDPMDDPTDDPSEDDPPVEEPSEDPPEEDPTEDPDPEEPPEEQKPEDQPIEEQKPEDQPSEEQKPEDQPSEEQKPQKPVEPSYSDVSDWTDWPSGSGSGQGGEGTGGTGGSAGGGNTPVEPNEEAQSDLIYTEIYNAEEEIIAYSVKADLEHNKNAYIEIPDLHNNLPVTVIEEKGFMNLSTLKTIRLPSFLTTINYEAFCGSKLEEIYIPDSVTFIDMRVFADCLKLKKVRLPENSEYIKIEYECFHNCPALGRFVIPNQIKTIATRAFEMARLQSLVIGTGVTYINHQAFNESKITQGICIFDLEKWCNIKLDSQISSPLYWGHRLFLWKDQMVEEIKDLVIPESIEELGRFQFGGCTSIETVDMSHIKSFRDEVFIHCTNIKKVILPESVPEFTANLFYDCRSLEEIVIPDGITSIPYCCFYNCRALKKIVIPESVTFFGSLSIWNCESLEEIVYKGSKEDWNAIYNRDGWMWFSGTGDFVIKCTDGEISKEEDRGRYQNPFEVGNQGGGTGYFTVKNKEEYDS